MDRCLFCGHPVPLFVRLAGEHHYCSKEHKRAYIAEVDQRALESLQRPTPKPDPDMASWLWQLPELQSVLFPWHRLETEADSFATIATVPFLRHGLIARPTDWALAATRPDVPEPLWLALVSRSLAIAWTSFPAAAPALAAGAYRLCLPPWPCRPHQTVLSAPQTGQLPVRCGVLSTVLFPEPVPLLPTRQGTLLPGMWFSDEPQSLSTAPWSTPLLPIRPLANLAFSPTGLLLPSATPAFPALAPPACSQIALAEPAVAVGALNWRATSLAASDFHSPAPPPPPYCIAPPCPWLPATLFAAPHPEPHSVQRLNENPSAERFPRLIVLAPSQLRINQVALPPSPTEPLPHPAPMATDPLSRSLSTPVFALQPDHVRPKYPHAAPPYQLWPAPWQAVADPDACSSPPPHSEPAADAFPAALLHPSRIAPSSPVELGAACEPEPYESAPAPGPLPSAQGEIRCIQFPAAPLLAVATPSPAAAALADAVFTALSTPPAAALLPACGLSSPIAWAAVTCPPVSNHAFSTSIAWAALLPAGSAVATWQRTAPPATLADFPNAPLPPRARIQTSFPIAASIAITRPAEAPEVLPGGPQTPQPFRFTAGTDLPLDDLSAQGDTAASWYELAPPPLRDPHHAASANARALPSELPPWTPPRKRPPSGLFLPLAHGNPWRPRIVAGTHAS